MINIPKIILDLVFRFGVIISMHLGKTGYPGQGNKSFRIARNISKNTAIVIDEHYVPSFKPSKVFVNKIKGSPKVG